MKHIVKGTEPDALTTQKAEWLTKGTTATWAALTGDVSSAIRDALFAEQGCLCCYCGRRIRTGDSHIEHFVPRDETTGDPSLTFEWSNLLASCQGNLTKGDPWHCGKKKDNWYDPALLVSPLDPACEARFRFELDGRMKAAAETDAGARETILRLDLDGARLRGLRKAAIDGLFTMLDGDLGPEEYERLAEAYRNQDANGRYESFCFVMLAILRELMPAPGAPS